MSLRELARRHLDSVSQEHCPASGHLGVSGPDKTAKRQVSLGVEPVRTGYSVRTPFSRPDALSGSDSVKRADKPDSLDTSDRSDGPDTVGRYKPTIHRCACGSAGVHGVGWFVRQPDRATWFCSECFAALRAAGQA